MESKERLKKAYQDHKDEEFCSKELLEDIILIYRVQCSPERSVFKVDAHST